MDKAEDVATASNANITQKKPSGNVEQELNQKGRPDKRTLNVHLKASDPFGSGLYDESTGEEIDLEKAEEEGLLDSQSVQRIEELSDLFTRGHLWEYLSDREKEKLDELGRNIVKDIQRKDENSGIELEYIPLIPRLLSFNKDYGSLPFYSCDKNDYIDASSIRPQLPPELLDALNQWCEDFEYVASVKVYQSITPEDGEFDERLMRIESTLCEKGQELADQVQKALDGYYELRYSPPEWLIK